MPGDPIEFIGLLNGPLVALQSVMTILVNIKSVYGEERIYPSCHLSELFAKLVGQKTLTRADIEIIKQLGYTIEVLVEKKAL